MSVSKTASTDQLVLLGSSLLFAAGCFLLSHRSVSTAGSAFSGAETTTLPDDQQRQRTQQLYVPQTSIGNTGETVIDPSVYPVEIKEELYSRVKTFFSTQGFSNIENSYIIVVGLGGVGSHCANMLARSGVSRLRLIDFDQVTLSSLNRHAVANMSDVGSSKAAVLRKRLLQVVPWCHIEGIAEMFRLEDADRLILGGDSSSSKAHAHLEYRSNGDGDGNDNGAAVSSRQPDFVIDCIDDVNTKAELIAYCLQHDIKILTSMGAGGKADPTKLRIAPLTECINDPLASKIKWKLRKQHGVGAEQVMTVFSAEKPMCDLLPLDEEQQQAPQEFGAVDHLRIRVMPVLGTSPSVFGQALASYVLCSAAQRPYDPDTCERISNKLKHKVRQVFKKNEIQRFGTEDEINLDEDDIEFIVQQVWRGRCAISGRRFGGHVILTLARWDPAQPPTPANVVLLMQSEANKLLPPAAAVAQANKVAKAAASKEKGKLGRSESTAEGVGAGKVGTRLTGKSPSIKTAPSPSSSSSSDAAVPAQPPSSSSSSDAAVPAQSPEQPQSQPTQRTQSPHPQHVVVVHPRDVFPAEVVQRTQSPHPQHAEVVHPRDVFPAEVVQRIEQRLAWARRVCADSWERVDHLTGPDCGNRNPDGTVLVQFQRSNRCAPSHVGDNSSSVDSNDRKQVLQQQQRQQEQHNHLHEWSGQRAASTATALVTATSGALAVFLLGYKFGSKGRLHASGSS